jgi:hypothetical protein
MSVQLVVDMNLSVEWVAELQPALVVVDVKKLRVRVLPL